MFHWYCAYSVKVVTSPDRYQTRINLQSSLHIQRREAPGTRDQKSLFRQQSYEPILPWRVHIEWGSCSALQNFQNLHRGHCHLSDAQLDLDDPVSSQEYHTGHLLRGHIPWWRYRCKTVYPRPGCQKPGYQCHVASQGLVPVAHHTDCKSAHPCSSQLPLGWHRPLALFL